MARKKTNAGNPDDILEAPAIDRGYLEPIDKPLNKDYLDELAFMNEQIIINVHESTDLNAENPVPVGNCGQFRFFERGKNILTQRKFADCLFAKGSSVSTPEIFKGGEKTYAIRQHAAAKYPFTIIEDKNPKGVEWYRRRQAEMV